MTDLAFHSIETSARESGRQSRTVGSPGMSTRHPPTRPTTSKESISRLHRPTRNLAPSNPWRRPVTVLSRENAAKRLAARLRAET